MRQKIEPVPYTDYNFLVVLFAGIPRSPAEPVCYRASQLRALSYLIIGIYAITGRYTFALWYIEGDRLRPDGR